MKEVNDILVPIDFSDHSSAALEAATEIAKRFGAKVWLLHCYPVYSGGVTPYSIVTPARYYRDIRNEAECRLRQSQEKMETEGVEAESSVSPTNPHEAIVSRAKGIGVDLIVMGTRGLTGFKHAMLGSVAERTVRLAPCPVLTVKAEEPE
jgi:nucleotide-binding universal stress UspA family protein